jgi:hypothetical protein
LEIFTFEFYKKISTLIDKEENKSSYKDGNFQNIDGYEEGFIKFNRDIDLTKIGNLEIVKNENGNIVPNATDRQNIKIIYDTLKDITPAEASSPELWSKIHHIDAYDYIRKRYPKNCKLFIDTYVDNKTYYSPKKKKDVFVTDKQYKRFISRNFTLPDYECISYRSKISGLWWAAHLINQREIKENFDIDLAYKLITKTTDIISSIFGRPVISNFTNLLLSVLRSLERNPEFDQSSARDLLKRIGSETNGYDVNVLSQDDLDDKVNLMHEEILKVSNS